MAAITIAQGATWAISAIAAGGVIGRPWRLPEAVWAVLGAASLVALALVPLPDALCAIGRGTDVYLFLTGMMLLAELARKEGVLDWLAALSAQQARGSARRLFALVFAVGTVVTVLLSNDATTVVLTPAVYAAARAAGAEPLPYLLICAFIANAASFVLPISNPANLVVFGGHVPPLSSWLAQFAVPSILSIGATYVMLRLSQRASLRQTIAREVPVPVLSNTGWLTVSGSASPRRSSSQLRLWVSGSGCRPRLAAG
jgi:arsenical pump membrane protein